MAARSSLTPGLVDDVVRVEMGLGPLELLVVGAQRRAAIAGDVARRVQPGGEVALPLHQRQAHQRLDAGDEDPPRRWRVLVVEADLEAAASPAYPIARLPQASTRRPGPQRRRPTGSSAAARRRRAGRRRWCPRPAGWRRYATMAAISAVVSNRCSSEVGRAVWKNSRSISSSDLPWALARSLMNCSTPSERVGPGSTEFTVTRGAGRGLGETARQGHLHGLGDAVVDHLDRDVHRRLRRDEDDPAPACGLHARQVMARQPHAAHEVDLDHPLPFGVGDLLERARLEDAQIVDQDVEVGKALRSPARPPRRCRGRPRAAPASAPGWVGGCSPSPRRRGLRCGR